MFTEAMARLVADEEFVQQDRVLKQFGVVGESVRAYRLSAGKVSSATQVQIEGTLEQSGQKLVEKLLKKYPAVVTTFEGWFLVGEEGGRQDRREAVCIAVHSAEGVWSMSCPIERSPSASMTKGVLDLVERTDGGLSDGGMDKKAVERAAERLASLLKNGGVRWKEEAATILSRALEQALDVRPITQALYDPTVPEERLATATAMMERVVCESHTTDDGRSGLRTVDCLAGANVSIRLDDRGRGADLHGILISLTQRLNAHFIQAGIGIRGHNSGAVGIASDFTDVSVVRHLQAAGRRWAVDEGAGPSFDLAEATLDNSFEEELAMQLGNHGVDSLRLTVVVNVRYFESVHVDTFKLLLESKEDPRLELSRVLKLSEEGFRSVVAEVAAEHNIDLEFDGVGPLFDQLRRKGIQIRKMLARQLVAHSIEMAKEGGRQITAEDLRLVVGSAYAELPAKRVSVMLTLWDSEGLCVAFITARNPTWSVAHEVDLVLEAFREAGVQRKEAWPALHRVKELPLDMFGEPMFPDASGSWFSAASMKAPEAVGVLQTLSWDFLRSEDSDDPVVMGLPVPHMLQRLGAASVVQRHFVPTVYKVFKDSFSRDDRSIEECWKAATASHEGLQKLAARDAEAVLPPDVVALALQVQWSRAPTLTVRPGLVDVLRSIDISKKIPASMIAAPFKLQYVHFGPHDAVAEIKLGSDSEAEATMVMVGAFVRQFYLGEERRLDVRMVWQGTADKRRMITSAVTVEAHDKGRQVQECIEAAVGAHEVEGGVSQAMAGALEEVVKVLFYTVSKEARMVRSDDRAQALRDVGKKSAEQQQKMLQRARGLIDHILVGPEKMRGAEDLGEGATRRQTKVTVRRGHYHGYWTGPGRTELIIHLLEPVIVNKHLLGAGEEPPRPKDYKLH